MKDDKALKIFKSAVCAVMGAAMVFVFARNAFPVTGEAFVTDEAWTSSVQTADTHYPSVSQTEHTQSTVPESTASVTDDVLSLPDVSSSYDVSSDILTDPEEGSSIGSVSETPEPPESSMPASEQPAGLININTASSAELQRLNGIGEVKAQAIIDYREQNGAFSSVDELINVKGIGEKTLEKIRDMIKV